MPQEKITSTTHLIVKRFVKLRQDKSFRQEEKSVIIVGLRLIKEISFHFEIKTLIVDRDFPDISAKKTLFATQEILKKITGLQEPEGIAAELALPDQGLLEKNQFLLILDGISDPGNLGTLLRTALALGWDGVFLTPQTADPFNDKAMRASKGACFFLPIQQGSYDELDLIIKKNNMTIYVADMRGQCLDSCQIKTPLALILGSESHGPSAWSKKQSSAISIPMTKNSESLNVGAAGAILMYQLRNI